MKKGFTLLELLVASLLLGMLLTILTQLFSQSSIAWRTGESGVAELDRMRADISAIQRDADNAILVSGNLVPLCSVWDTEKSGAIAERGYRKSGKFEFNKFKNVNAKSSSWTGIKIAKQDSTEEVKNYMVGVTSAGPDGQFDTWDDITSWPNDSDD